MIPTTLAEGDSRLPKLATFWMPGESELDDEGVGFFRGGVWTIIGVPRAKAQQIMDDERHLLQAVDGLASTAEHFERLARYIGLLDPGESDHCDVEILAAERAVVDVAMNKCGSNPLDCLELGVAGLVNALSCRGVIPAASCRGHTGERPCLKCP